MTACSSDDLSSFPKTRSAIEWLSGCDEIARARAAKNSPARAIGNQQDVQDEIGQKDVD
jgi:hypothetical protein